MTKMKRQAGHYPRLGPYGVASESLTERGAPLVSVPRKDFETRRRSIASQAANSTARLTAATFSKRADQAEDRA